MNPDPISEAARVSANSDATTPILAEGGADLERYLGELGEKPYRVGQIRRWLFRTQATGFDEMTNLSTELRARLAERFVPFSCELEQRPESPDHTTKLIVRLRDGEQIEAVLIREDARSTACISTQVGCPVGCPFCASGLDGTRRNLEAHEIVEQVLLLDRCLPESERLSHLVFMGIGEPLLNFRSLVSALETLHEEAGFGLAARRITLSTVGPKGKIERLQRIPIPINLAISLHAPNDELRDRLVPGNSGVRGLIAAAESYREQTGRQVTFEYVLLRDVNASLEHARELAGLLRSTSCSVNLIPFNPVPGTGFETPSTQEVHDFRRELERAQVPVTVRKRKGRAIEAACGQLRLNRIRQDQAS